MKLAMWWRSALSATVLGLMRLGSCPALAAQPLQPPPVTLTGTAVYELSFQGRTYPEWVDVPASYHSNQQDYPLLLVSDAHRFAKMLRPVKGWQVKTSDLDGKVI